MHTWCWRAAGSAAGFGKACTYQTLPEAAVCLADRVLSAVLAPFHMRRILWADNGGGQAPLSCRRCAVCCVLCSEERLGWCPLFLQHEKRRFTVR